MNRKWMWVLAGTLSIVGLMLLATQPHDSIQPPEQALPQARAPLPPNSQVLRGETPHFDRDVQYQEAHYLESISRLQVQSTRPEFRQYAEQLALLLQTAQSAHAMSHAACIQSRNAYSPGCFIHMHADSAVWQPAYLLDHLETESTTHLSENMQTFLRTFDSSYEQTGTDIAAYRKEKGAEAYYRVRAVELDDLLARAKATRQKSQHELEDGAVVAAYIDIHSAKLLHDIARGRMADFLKNRVLGQPANP